MMKRKLFLRLSSAPGLTGTLPLASLAANTPEGKTGKPLLELGRYVKKTERIEMCRVAETILRSLSSPMYRSEEGENGGFLIKHNVGSLPHKSEVDVSLTYADYYFIEALLRYKQWYTKNK